MSVGNICLFNAWILQFAIYECLHLKTKKALETELGISVSCDGLTCGRASLFICQFFLILVKSSQFTKINGQTYSKSYKMM